jgi:carbonic anhydrase/acetyltransferase-like protein (isoleucine patch superfamily)
VLNRAVIGEDCIIGAGALVTEKKTFEPGSLIVGSPARAVRQLDDRARAMLLQSAAHYVEKAAHYAKELKRVD